MNIAEKIEIGHFALVSRSLTFRLESGIFRSAQFSTTHVLETNPQPPYEEYATHS